MSRRLHFPIRELVYALGIVALAGGCAPQSQTRQEHIHHHGHEVMPFDLNKTRHVFLMTEQGGVERVLVKDPGDVEQIKLIQQHLRHEAARFANGDYSDPAALHGSNMPGLTELQAGAAGVAVAYESLPNGAAITFTTRDIRLLTAIHRWFGAQLSEHGQDAASQ